MKLIILQLFFSLGIFFNIVIYPLIMGIFDKVNARIKKSVITSSGAICAVLLMVGAIFSITLLDKENVILWYGLTVLTVVISNIILLNTERDCKKIENPKKLKEYIHNAKCDCFEDSLGRFLIKSRFLIYLWYILLTVLNQIGELSTNIFSDSLYLKVNEYSLILLFAIDEMVKLFKERKQKKL